jgi:hypothetical protein
VSGAQGIEAKKRLAELTDGTDQLLGTGQEGEGTHGNATADERKSSINAQKNGKPKEATEETAEVKETQGKRATRERQERRVAFFAARMQEQQVYKEQEVARVAERNRQNTERT